MNSFMNFNEFIKSYGGSKAPQGSTVLTFVGPFSSVPLLGFELKKYKNKTIY